MKAKINGLILVLSVALPALAQEIAKPPGVVVNHIGKETGRYIGSPSLCVLPNGTYIATHDEFGPRSSEFRSAQTLVFQSKDKGMTWEKITQIDGQFWSNLFFHRGSLYLMGTNKHHGNLIIRKSDDDGYTWTIPYLKSNGLILEGEYHTAPMPIVYQNGRIWRAVEYATAPTSEWGKRYSAMVVSAPVDADLLDAESWQKTNYLSFNSDYLNGNFRAWLEGNAVVDPDGNVVDILRVDIPAGIEEQAAVVRISQDGKIASFDPDRDFIQLPGGSKKFTIRYDERSKRYWMLTNYISPEYKERHPAGVRNKQALCSSSDLREWMVHQVVLDHPDVEKHGFQYVDWLFEGDDIIFLSRTAYDDDSEGANNNHDANFLTFHRIVNFRNLLKK